VFVDRTAANRVRVLEAEPIEGPAEGRVNTPEVVTQGRSGGIDVDLRRLVRDLGPASVRIVGRLAAFVVAAVSGPKAKLGAAFDVDPPRGADEVEFWL
jgi:hypothetical protein